MTVDDIRAKLEAAGFEVADMFRAADNTGWRLRLSGAVLVCFYDTGRIILQGQDTAAVHAALEAGATKSRESGLRKVFVVSGDDLVARTELEWMLRRWGLEPTSLTSSDADVMDRIESTRREAQFAVVIATPDDEGHERGHSEKRLFRARQNVVLELGMMLALLGKTKVAVLVKGGSGMERPSEMEGLVYIPWNESVSET